MSGPGDGRARVGGAQLVEQARAALSADEPARATELGRRLTIENALDLARPPREALAP